MNNNTQPEQNDLDGLNEELDTAIDNMPFWVFLCGPTLNTNKPEDSACKPEDSARLRQKIKNKLQKNRFRVFLGEDDGLKELKKRFGSNAQQNELNLVKAPECRIVILIADSVGSYCELGLFNWLFADNDDKYFDRNKITFYVIADKTYENDESYFNEGPIETLRLVGGHIKYDDFATFDVDTFVEELKALRGLYLKPYDRDS